MEPVKKLEAIIASWPEISAHPHQFSTREFRFKKAEVGHVHDGGMVDIPFPRTVHDALLEEGLAEQHPWVRRFRLGYLSHSKRPGCTACRLADAVVVFPLCA